MNTYTYKECYEASLEYFNGDDLASKVFLDKYALQNLDNELLEKTPEDMHHGLAKEFARIEKKKYGDEALTKEEIFGYFDRFKYIVPQGSPMYGIGNKHRFISISNCVVAESPVDSYGGICRTDQQLVQLSKRRCGVGINLSNLRPSGTLVTNSAGSSSGIVSWMQRYSNSTREVGQSGRRGALLLGIDVHHPEVEAFATIKKDKTKVTGANVSVMLSDEFLEAVDNKKDYEQRFPVNQAIPEMSQMVDANKVWDTIIERAWEWAEPGLLFWDNILRNSPADCYSNFGFKTVCVNPCSELPLSVLDTCRLLVLNLYNFVENPYTKNATFLWDKFHKYAKIAQRLMDDVVDLEIECLDRIINKIKKDPEPDCIKEVELTLWMTIKVNCMNGRRTGTGITALGDTLAALGASYCSKKGMELAENIYKTLKFACYESSIDMAEKLGTFDVWDHNLEKDNEFLCRFKNENLDLPGLKESGKGLYNRMKLCGRRNIALLTTAPTGSVSILTQTSSGMEPAFQLKYIRRKKGNPSDKDFRSDFVDQNGDHWMEFEVFHHAIKHWSEVTGKTDITKSPWSGSTSGDLNWQKRVELQGKITQHIDHAISSTVNIPNNTTKEEVAKIYTTAWKSGCKGITVYREGCRDGVIISKQENTRPKELSCNVYHVTVKGKQYFVLVGLLDNAPYELFAGINGCLNKDIKHGTIIRKRKSVYKAVFNDKNETELTPLMHSASDEESAITRLVSLCLRSNTPINDVVTQLENIEGDFQSFSKAIIKALKKYLKDGEKISDDCPECGTQLIRLEGCRNCKSCGWSKC